MINLTFSGVSKMPKLSILAGLALFLATSAFAQDPPDPVLPNLAPREVEIRGQLVIQFPALERQPLIGFNPPPRIPVVPADRRPLVGEYKQGRADLPESSIERPSPPGALLSGAEFLRGELEASGGSYFDRLVRGRLAADLGKSSVALLRFDYLGSDGSLVGDSVGSQVRNPRDSFSGAVGIRSHSQTAHYGVELSGLNDTYTLFGLRTADDSLSAFSPGRRVNGATAQLSFGTAQDRSAETQTSIWLATSGARTDAEVDSLSIPDSRMIDRRAELQSVNSIAISDVDLVIDLAGGLARLSSEQPVLGVTSTTNQSQAYYNSGLRLERSGARFNASLGLNIIGTAVDTDLDDNGPKRKLSYLTPTIHLDLHPVKGLTLFLRNRPEILSQSVSEAFRKNPYGSSLPSLQPTLLVVQSDVGASIGIDPLQIQFVFGYDQSPNWQYFAATSGEMLSGYFSPLYDKATVYRGMVKADLDLTGSLHGSVSATFREGRLTDSDEKLPYYPDWIGNASLQYRFLNHRALIQLDGRFLGERFADVPNTILLDPTVDLDATVLFNVTRAIGLTVRGRNLLGNSLEFWDGFPQIDRQILGGFRLLW